MSDALVATIADGAVTVTAVIDDTTGNVTQLVMTNDTQSNADGEMMGVTITIPPGGLTVAIPMPGYPPMSFGDWGTARLRWPA